MPPLQSLIPEFLCDEDPLGALFLESVSARDRRAQEAGLTLFWAHDLKKLGRFVASVEAR